MMNERKTMVVKIGSSTLVEAGELRRDFIASLAAQARDLRDAGWDLVVVSSGAIACGAPLLGFDKRPTDMPSPVSYTHLIKDEDHRDDEREDGHELADHDDGVERARLLHAAVDEQHDRPVQKRDEYHARNGEIARERRIEISRCV